MDLKDLLAVLVSHDSVFGNEKSLAEWMLWFLKKEGFTIEKQPVDKNRFNVLAYRGKGETSLLLYGHLDTVPIYQGWRTEPLSLTEDGDKLYGLGACDMKGGIAAILQAVTSIPKDQPVRILFAVDEENDSEGAWTLSKHKPEWLKHITHIISAEPGASATKIGGANVLTLGRRGRARFTVKIKGYSAHGGHIDRGVNAISLASQLISKIESMKPVKHPHLGEGSQFIAKIESSARGLSIPEYCELEIDRHLVLPETVNGCLEQYQKLCQEVLDDCHVSEDVKSYISINVELKRRKHNYMEPYETDKTDSYVTRVSDIITQHAGPVTINYGRSVGDENIFANELGIKPLILGPEGGNVHSPNEWVSFDSLQQTSQIYSDIISYLAD